MSTIFPGSASVGQIFEGYEFNGTAWDIIGIDLTANYPEILEGKISASVIPDIFATNEYVDGSAISASAAAVTYLVDSAPETLNTLNELSAALNDDANFATTVTTSLGNKLDASSASTTYLTQSSASTTYVNPSTTPISGFRNAIINGDFTVHQRGGTVSVGGANSYTLDRWYGFSSGTFTGQQSTDTPAGRRLSNSLLLTCTVADTSIAAGDFNSISQRIEGYYAAQLGYGSTGNTQTLSFWVKSSLVGTYCVSFRNNAVNRSYVAEYSINSANTWERKTITLPVDDSGTWEKTNGIGIRLDFSLAMGTNFQTATPNTWTSGSLTSTANQVNWMSSASSRTFQLSGVQLETGSIATPFEQRPIGTELSLCQRYYLRYNSGVSDVGVLGMALAYSTTAAFTSLLFPVDMRTTPTVNGFNTVTVGDGISGFGTFTGITVSTNTGNSRGVLLNMTGSSSLTATRAYNVYISSPSGFVALSAEL